MPGVRPGVGPIHPERMEQTLQMRKGGKPADTLSTPTHVS